MSRNLCDKRDDATTSKSMISEEDESVSNRMESSNAAEIENACHACDGSCTSMEPKQEEKTKADEPCLSDSSSGVKKLERSSCSNNGNAVSVNVSDVKFAMTSGTVEDSTTPTRLKNVNNDSKKSSNKKMSTSSTSKSSQMKTSNSNAVGKDMELSDTINVDEKSVAESVSSVSKDKAACMPTKRSSRKSGRNSNSSDSNGPKCDFSNKHEVIPQCRRNIRDEPPPPNDKEWKQPTVSILKKTRVAKSGDKTKLPSKGTHAYEREGNENLQLMNLPSDAFHCIASFVSPVDWRSLSCTSAAANRSCRAVFQRVRMHGFRCATEIVAAWVRGELSDARELVALYVKYGVPIYPPCLGHTYHTLTWRMMVESRELENQNASSPENSVSQESNSDQSTTTPDFSKLRDKFYSERYEARDRAGYFLPSLTYLQEKCLFWKYKHEEELVVAHSGSGHRTYHSFFPNPAGFGGARAQFMHLFPQPPGSFPRAPARRPMGYNPSLQGHRTASSALRGGARQSNVMVKVHCHLANQHLLGHPVVTDEDSSGSIQAGAISLSVDFFHPLPETTSPMSSSPEWMESDQITDNSNFEENDLANFNMPPPNDMTNLNLPPPMFPFVTLPSLLPPTNLPHSILSDVTVQIYNGTRPSSTGSEEEASLSALQIRLDSFQRKLECFLDTNDCSGFDECLLDFWDEFFPQTAGIHYFDKHTPVPRLSTLHSFLTKPCPKSIGIVQCEIERIRRSSSSKRTSVKGRLFPTYEYRLFIRDRRPAEGHVTPDHRKDTVLMTAKNRGKNYQGASPTTPSSQKRGVNNYFLYMSNSEDSELHHKSVHASNNTSEDITSKLKTSKTADDPPIELGRLQSNFIGTEFQIFSPSHSHKTNYSSDAATCFSSESEGETDTELLSSPHSTKLRLSTQTIDTDDRSISSKSSRSGRRKRSNYMPSLRSRRRAIANSENEPNDNTSTPLSSSCPYYEDEDGAITYTANLLGNRPRVMDVCIPKLNEDGTECEWRRYTRTCIRNGEGSKMLTSFKQLQERLNTNSDNVQEEEQENDPDNTPSDFGLLALQNRPPWWNIELGAFVLNFGGRVSVASVKNFQLCDRNDQDHIMLQFGRIQGRHSFTMDFQYPLTAMQAFAIAISSLQSKISLG